MAKKFCLTKEFVDKFRKALTSKEIGPQKLEEVSKMSSAKRREFLEKFVGADNAKEVNALFESKLLLKNQKAGMLTWAKNVSGLTTQAKRDLISRIERLDKVLDPEAEKAFLNDLASSKLGVDVTQAEAKAIADLSISVRKTREVSGIDEISKGSQADIIEYVNNPKMQDKRLAYGRKVIELDNFVTKLKDDAEKLTPKERLKRPTDIAIKTVKTPLELSKTMKATLDLSYMFNQGYGVLTNFKTVKIWGKNSLNSINVAVKTLGGKNVWDEFRADIVSRPNSVNGLYREQKLAINVTEEAFPTTLPGRVPGIGRAFTASEQSFSIFQMKNRADMFDMFAAQAERNGLQIAGKNTQVEGLGQWINSLTARAGLGKFEPAGDWANILFFSPRKLVAVLDAATFYQVRRKQSAFVRKQGALAATQQIFLSVMVMSIAKGLSNDSIELDPRSADFGKIKIGDTRISIVPPGQLSSYTLIARLASGQSKSSTTGEIKSLTSGKFGAPTRLSVLSQYISNKAAPGIGEIMAWLKGRTFEGTKPTILGSIISMYLPLGIENVDELLKNPNSMNWQLGSLLDFLGIITNTYPDANLKSKLIPTGALIKNDNLINGIRVYAKALGTDPETAFNRIFTGQKIIQISPGNIIVVDRDSSLAERAVYTKKYGKDAHLVKLDHTIPIKLGGSDLDSNTELVPTSVWQSYTAVELAMIKAVKKGKIEVKEAQKLIVEFKKIEDTKARKLFGESLRQRFK